MIRFIPAKTRSIVLICSKCSKKVGGGFGAKGKTHLAKKLRQRHDGKGRKADTLVVETACLKLCPKDAIVVVNSEHPEKWLLVRPRTDIEVVATSLGLR